MTPSLFAGTDAVDEHTFMSTPDAAGRLRRHHETFITESDLAWIAEQGLDLVRLPVGHWVLGGDEHYLGALDILDAAMDWAARLGLAVLLDLHAVSGSQNGQDHSGRVGPRRWYRERAHREHTHGALAGLAARYATHPALWGLELVNEPMDWRIWRLRHFHRDAYRDLAARLAPGTHVVFSDGYVPWLLRGSLPGSPHLPTVIDSHFYQAFYPWDVPRTVEHHIKKARRRDRTIRWLSRRQPVIVGEWSAGLSPRAYGGRTGPERRPYTKAFLDAQLEGFAGALAWCFWSYKTEDADDWNFRHLVETGLFTL
jgi:glucan 1,3-beta-glucosidase